MTRQQRQELDDALADVIRRAEDIGRVDSPSAHQAAAIRSSAVRAQHALSLIEETR